MFENLHIAMPPLFSGRASFAYYMLWFFIENLKLSPRALRSVP